MFLPSTDGMYGRTASRPAVDSALTLVRERAELHGGRIWVTSQVGRLDVHVYDSGTPQRITAALRPPPVRQVG